MLDLTDEYAATINFAAGLHYLDAATLENWGINMFEVSSAASIPVITSDGIRLAYHNGIVDLTQFTDQFPVGDIVEGLGNTIAGVGDIEMSDLLWVSQAEAGGVFDVAGGLNFLTQQGAPSRLPPGRCSTIASKDPTPWTKHTPFTSKRPVNPSQCGSSTSSSLRGTKIQP